MAEDDGGTATREDGLQATAGTTATEDKQRTATGGRENGRTSSELVWTTAGRSSKGKENDRGGEGN